MRRQHLEGMGVCTGVLRTNSQEMRVCREEHGHHSEEKKKWRDEEVKR